MHRWITRLFAITTLGPVLIWLGCVGAVLYLSGIHGCHITEAGVQPCVIFGRDIGQSAATMGILAAWGPLLIGPVVAASAMAWGLYALIRRLRRGAGRG